MLRRLEEVWSIKFKFSIAPVAKCKGVIVPYGVEPELPIGISTLKFVGGNRFSQETNPTARLLTVKFETLNAVPLPFRGRTLTSTVVAAPGSLNPSAEDEILAYVDSNPVWLRARTKTGVTYRTGFALPCITESQNFSDMFSGDRLFEALPLLHWLRELGVWGAELGSELRAAFVFDDPNLHWVTYGNVDYREVVRSAKCHHYHVSFATIPLDMWYSHRKTVELFRSNPAELSLCVHGNDHLKKELARDYSSVERRKLLCQSWLRKEKFQQKTGLKVSPVMVPPHGACSTAMLEELIDCGFEGACISHGSLSVHNPQAQWLRLLGLRRYELVEHCPVMPRWAFGNRDRNFVLVAAYLGQAMILRGHHQDLKSGIDLLVERAAFINGLGDVRWADLAQLNQHNYGSNLVGGRLVLYPNAPRIFVSQVPESAKEIVVSHMDKNSRWGITSFASGNHFELVEGQAIECSGEEREGLLVEQIRSVGCTQESVGIAPGFKPLVRRVLTEVRDRFLN